MNVEFSKKFAKQFRNCLDKKLKEQIVGVISSCEKASSIQAVANLKKLKTFKNFYRIRIDDYRIGLSIENETVVFVSFYHRREFYRFFP